MDENYRIKVENIEKKFKVYYDKGHTLKEKLLFSKRRAYEERKVLRGVSFSVKPGEAVGLIGHNGCGKSTTLKLLSKIMYPDAGKILMHGRVSSLIELGAGFHPDMSGKENIYINASIFGLTKKEIDNRLEEIIAFSELEDFIDNPVRTYSSGMYMRLAFSVAINVDADILLIDEILAVGDAAFQQKCFNRLKEIKESGVTIVIVSHSLGQIEEICDRTIWIHEGLIKQQGIPKEVHKAYMDFVVDKRAEIADKEVEREQKKREETKPEESQEYIGNGKAKIKSVRLFDITGREKKMLETGQSMVLQIELSQYDSVEEMNITVAIVRIDGVLCSSFNTLADGLVFQNERNDKIIVRLNIPAIELVQNQYFIDVAINGNKREVLDYLSHACRFEMISKKIEVGVVRTKGNWNVI